MASPRRVSQLPWIIAGAAGLVLAVLLALYFAVLLPHRSDLVDQKNAMSVGDLNAAEAKAVEAAGVETVNLLSFRRAHFDADFQRALDGATGSLRSDVTSKKAATLKAMTTGKFDLGAKMTHQALEGPTDPKAKGYVVLVVVNAYRSTTQNQPLQQNLEITMVPVKGKWLASDVQNVGLQ